MHKCKTDEKKFSPFLTLSCAAGSAWNEVYSNPNIHHNIHRNIPAAEFWLDPHKWVNLRDRCALGARTDDFSAWS